MSRRGKGRGQRRNGRGGMEEFEREGGMGGIKEEKEGKKRKWEEA